MLKRLLIALLVVAWLPVQAAVSRNLEVIHGAGATVTLNFSEAAWVSRVNTVRLWRCSSVESCETQLPEAAPTAGRLSFEAADGSLFRADLLGSALPKFASGSSWAATKWVLWSQFVVGAQTATSTEFEALARRHAPILSFHEREEYFPITLDQAFDRSCSDFANGILSVGCAYDSAESVDPAFWASSSDTDSASQFMRWNGHRDLAVYLKPTVAKSFRTTLGAVGATVPSYWFAQKSGDTAWITYAYFYAFDQKRNEYLDSGVGADKGSHAIDRESITIEFKRQGSEWVPDRVIYAGHMPDQPTMYLGCRDSTLCDEKGYDKFNPIARWNGGKVAVSWDHASRWGDSPIGYVAEGSHAIKPARGWYFVNVALNNDVTEPAGSLDLSNLRRSRVQPLPIASEPSLAFSGLTIDGALAFNSRIFPFVRFPISEWSAGTEQPLDNCFADGSCRTNTLRSPRLDREDEVTILGNFVPRLPTRITLRGNDLNEPSISQGATNIEEICSASQTLERTASTITIECIPKVEAVGRYLVVELLAPPLIGDVDRLRIYRGEWVIKALPSIQLSSSSPSVLDRVVVWLSDVWATATNVLWQVMDSGERLLASFFVEGSPAAPEPFKQDLGPLPAGSATVSARVMDRDLQGVTVSTIVNVQVANAAVLSVLPTAATAGVSQTFTVSGANLPVGLIFSLDGCLGVQEQPGGTNTIRQFKCAFPVATAGGPKSGSVSLASSTPPTVLKTFSVILDSSASAGLFDDFSGGVVDTTKWTNNGYIVFGPAPVGVATVDASGFAQFPAWAALNTKDKVTFSGTKIVVEARMGGVESRFILADGPDPGQSLIMISNTPYCGWGINVQARGPYKPSGPNGGCGADIPVPAAGGYTGEVREYRLTIDGASVLVESGPTLANITQSLTTTLGASIAGKSFFLTIGTASASYSPGSFDWVRVAVDQPTVRGVLNPSNGHRYEVITCGTWADCRTAAQARGGQLVTIRSEAENAWLVSTFAESRLRNFGFWIGLTDEVTEGQWKWVSGEPVSYTRWLPSQPSNSFGGESYAHLWWYGLDLVPPNPSGALIGWNDVNAAGSGATITQAIVEYVEDSSVSVDHLAIPTIYDNAGQSGYTYGQTFLAQGNSFAGVRVYIGDPTRLSDSSVNELVGAVQLVLYKVEAGGMVNELSSQTLGSATSSRRGLVEFRFDAPVSTSPGSKYFIGLRTTDQFGLGLRAATSSTYVGGAEAWISPGAGMLTEHPTGRDASFAVLSQ
jgi:hypothetical protein